MWEPEGLSDSAAQGTEHTEMIWTVFLLAQAVLLYFILTHRSRWVTFSFTFIVLYTCCNICKNKIILTLKLMRSSFFLCFYCKFVYGIQSIWPTCKDKNSRVVIIIKGTHHMFLLLEGNPFIVIVYWVVPSPVWRNVVKPLQVSLLGIVTLHWFFFSFTNYKMNACFICYVMIFF